MSSFEKRIFTINDVVEYTGLAKKTIQILAAAGKIPCSKPSNKILFFEREKLEAWMLSNTRATKEENEVAAATYIATKKVK